MAETTPKFVYNSITVTLTYPLAKNDPYETKAKRTDTFSVSGQKQTTFDYYEEIKEIDIQFATEAVKDALIDMYQDWASEGKTIAFYPDASSGTNVNVTIVENSFKVERQATGTAIWKVKFNIRKDI